MGSSWKNMDVKRLRITICKELKFDKHVLKICSKARRNLSVLARNSTFLNLKRQRISLQISLNHSLNTVHSPLKRIKNPVEHLRWSYFAKIGNHLKALTIFTKGSTIYVRQCAKYSSTICKATNKANHC